MNESALIAFQKKILDFGTTNFRNMPWRETEDPYAILVSEIMLQQTQVDRVVAKYQEFMNHFPNLRVLAHAPFNQVLQVWSGLGYNRRALSLHKTAQVIHQQHHDKIPASIDELVKFPGIGHNTAAAIMVYAFNKPEIFIETNIRSVFIHEFFTNKDEIEDKELLSLVKKTLDMNNPRIWYWALMDYGNHLKKLHKNPSRKSKHYAKQSSFAGSNRQLRGDILRILLQESLSLAMLQNQFDYPHTQTQATIQRLVKEGLITQDEKGLYSVSS